MSNWKLINKTLLYDGTFDGLLTIVFDCYSTKTLPQKIQNKQTYFDNFLDNIAIITSDYQKSERVFNGIEKNICYDALYNSFYAFLSDEQDKEINILKYLCNGFDIGPKINTMLTTSYVYKVISMKRRASFECHKFKGLLRFAQVDNNLFYASIHPDTNIIEPLGQHFINRLPSQNFIIHDKNRNLGFLYNGETYQIKELPIFSLPEFSEQEKLYQKLWKSFFKSVTITERTNRKCQMQFMPKKYWKDLVESP